MEAKHVMGEDKGRVMLYALSTCVWCRKTKDLLKTMNVSFDYTDVDLLNAKERDEAMEEIRKWNPLCSFPSLIINNNCVVGYDEKKIRELLTI
ncbi:MAG: glutaredoxin family protein [Syntrophales bacterium]